jgi:hypothetical protein
MLDMEGEKDFELNTEAHDADVRCSIQLSYRRLAFRVVRAYQIVQNGNQ